MKCLLTASRYIPAPCLLFGSRGIASTKILKEKHSCKLLVVGGGSGGCCTAAKFSRILGKEQVIIVEPKECHFYQPMFTLIGGGIKKYEDSVRSMSSVLPKSAVWLRDEVVAFEPDSNCVWTCGGDCIEYEFMVVAVGISLLYDSIPGLEEGLQMPDSGVCSNYSPFYVTRTFEAMKKLDEGNAIFTYPNTPVKCAGAPQKILYLTDDYLRRHSKRDGMNLIYNTSLPVIFGVKKYADALWEHVDKCDIEVNLRTNLVEVRPDKNEAVFQDLNNPDSEMVCEYSMLHVCPPQGPPKVLKENEDLADPKCGFLDVHKCTLQHVKYPNVFGLGDCTNLPTSKTAAAVAAQFGILRRTLSAAMQGKDIPKIAYDGYTSCPLVTGYGRCILAEFDYDLQPMETFPINQGKERISMYFMKAYFMPYLYWHLYLKGYWEGPKAFRQVLHLGTCK